MVDSSKRDDLDQKSTTPLSDRSVSEGQSQLPHHSSKKIGYREVLMFCSKLLKMSIFCQLFVCCYSQFCEAVTARHKVWEMRYEKDGNSYLFLCFCVWGAIGLNVCVRMYLCTCMCGMCRCVTGPRLSPSLHPDSSVKQGLIWSVYVFENMCVYVSGLIVFLFFFVTLFTSDPPGVPGSCLMDSLAPLSWPLAWALSWTPN